MGDASQISTGKSSVDLTALAFKKKTVPLSSGRPNSLKSTHYFSVKEAEESEESPTVVAPTPLRKPVIHKLVPYSVPKGPAQKFRKGKKPPIHTQLNS